METYLIENFSFSYPDREEKVLENLNLKIKSGQFVNICGRSGCGKTTMLRHLKSILAPHGNKSGNILFEGKPLDILEQREQASKIGFVQQNPDNQLVTDKVWHELTFGLESLGTNSETIRVRVAEMASFFGIQTWFHKKVNELSGGQKQLLNLASIMVMQPSVLILDEPTSQLDPIAAQEFLETLAKINRELGTTILISEHRLEEVMPLSDRVLVIEKGKIIVDASPKETGSKLKALDHTMFSAMPVAIQAWAGVNNSLPCPLTTREGRDWLLDLSKVQKLNQDNIPSDKPYKKEGIPVVSLKEVSFRYTKESSDVVKNLSLDIYPKELFAIVGGNGAGKSTTISLISGLNKPNRGTLSIENKSLDEYTNTQLYDGLLGILPQNPQALFVKKTVELDLYEIFQGRKMSLGEQEKRVKAVSRLCELDSLLNSHPYDLSGGEQQRAALAKVLLLAPRILILDEPTKGLDSAFKQKLANILESLKTLGVTIIMVSHDIEFCAQYADRCAMFFDGSIVSEQSPRAFFSGQRFYTTATNRMARHILPNAVLIEDIIRASNNPVLTKTISPPDEDLKSIFSKDKKGGNEPSIINHKTEKIRQKLTPKRIAFGSIMLALFITTIILGTLEAGYMSFLELNENQREITSPLTEWKQFAYWVILIIELGLSLIAFLPGKDLGRDDFYESPSSLGEKRKLSKRTLVAMGLILILIPLTIYVGIYFFDSRKYYFISMMIILETMLPFVMVFEGRKPQAKELVVIAVLIAIAVAGRAALFMIPQFKPVIAMVIISGICFGAEAGFLVGAMTGFVSNFFFGQGPWTPWQMFAFGIIGFLAGMLFQKGFLRKRKSSLCIFGGIATLIIYGGIMNPASVLMFQESGTITKEMIFASLAVGLPFDIIHAVATVFFLWIIAEPMIEKLERIKVKYGLIK